MSLGSKSDAPPKTDHHFCTSSNTSVSPKSALSDDFESAVDAIRAGKNWIQKIVDRKKQEQKEEVQDDISDIFLPVATECVVQPRPRECSEAGSLSESDETVQSLEDAIQLSKFGSHRDRQHIYPIDIGRGSSESRSLQPKQKNWNCCQLTVGIGSLWQVLAPSAAILFAISVYIQLKQVSDNKFVWHPLLMNAMLVVMTVTTVLLQRSAKPYSSSSFQSRSRLRLQSRGIFCDRKKIHVFAQLGAAVACTGGMTVCLTEHKTMKQLDASKNIMHEIAGLIAVLLFAAQLFLGACTLLRYSEKPGNWQHSAVKFWCRNRRMLGYANLLFLWIAAWLGIHTSWSKSLETRETSQTLGHSEIYWICLFLAFISGLALPKFISNPL